MNDVNLVISAGGQGSRFRSLSIFPKLLLSTREFGSLLLRDVKDAARVASMTVILNDRFRHQFDCYTRVNGIQNLVKAVDVHDTRSSAETVLSRLDSIPAENVLLIWSDLEIDGLDRIISACAMSDHSIVFTNSAGRYRYGISAGEIRRYEDYGGNIPGIYFIKDMSVFRGMDYSSCDDFVNCVSAALPGVSSMDVIKIGASIREYRDLDEYARIMHEHTDVHDGQTRFFNKITAEPGGWLVKRVVDFKYQKLIDREKTWYRQLALFGGEDISPRIVETYDDGFKMQNLVGYVTLRRALDEFEDTGDAAGAGRLYQALFRMVERCSALSTLAVDRTTFERDLNKELVLKVLDRCEGIKDVLINYNSHHLECLLQQAYDRVLEFAVRKSPDKIEYGFCHGDLNGSNVMVDIASNSVKFIDPRGYFGDTELYGWKPYEYAKLLYCLMGYDDFNMRPQVYTLDWPEDRPSLRWSGFSEFAGEDYSCYRLMVGVIYVALAGYISQDIMKANIAYDYGVSIIQECLA